MSTKAPSKAQKALLRFRAYMASHYLSFCWGTYTLGILWLLLHPIVTVTTGELKCRGTYISENALLIDLLKARASRPEAQAAHNFHQKLLQVPELPSRGCGDNCTSVLDWIEAQLHGLERVEAYRHVFQSDLSAEPRTNVYGILRASPLADGKEAIVLVTHYRNIGVQSGTFASISLGLALLQYLAKVKWLAKDVILLAADDCPLDGRDGYAPGTAAWLEAYHLDPLDRHFYQTLPMRAGLIRAALNLETLLPSHHVQAVGLYTAGMNGQLPNLDLVNAAVHAFHQHQIPLLLDRNEAAGGLEKSRFSIFHTFKEQFAPQVWQLALTHYLTALEGMLQFMMTLASGPSGPHATFISYNIDSLTLSLTKQRDSTHDRNVSILQVFRSLEVLVRALSNLEEKLHQSFYLYVLPSATTFVSVGEYFYPIVLILSPAVAHFVHLATQTSGMRMAFALAIVLLIQAFGLVLLCGLCHYFVVKSSRNEWMLALVISIVQALVVRVIVPFLKSVPSFSGCQEIHEWRKRVKRFEETTKKSEKEEDEEDDDVKLDSGWRGIKLMTMAMLVYSHGLLGMLNYPMALFGALFLTPFATIVHISTATGWQNVWRCLWLVGSSPLVLLVSWRHLAGNSDITDVVTTFLHRLNLLALPYFCCIYVAIHTLALVIWLFPVSDTAHKLTEKTKHD